MAFFSLLPMLFALAFAAPDPAGGMRVRSITVEDHIIIRVPVRPPPRRLDWIERSGPRCIASQQIRGAFLAGGDHVDFLLSGRRLVRAQLAEDCPALDFYEGFYLNSQDERICSSRDSIRSRMGGSCRIERFRRLEPKLRR